VDARTPSVAPESVVTDLVATGFLTAVFAAHTFASPELVSVLLTGAVLLASLRFPEKLAQPLILMSPLLIMLMVGFSATIFNPGSTIDTVRSAWYIFRLPVIFISGYFIGIFLRSPLPVLWALVLVGTFAGADYVLRYVTDPIAMLSGTPRVYIRRHVGYGDIVTHLAVPAALMLASWSRRLATAIFATIAMVVCVAAIVLSTSRSAWLVILLVLVAWATPFRLRPLWIPAALTLFLAALLLTTPIVAQTLGQESLVSYLPGPFNEMNPGFYDNWFQLNKHWRGFETYMAFEQYFTGNTFALVFGQGYAVQAPLGGIAMRLGASETWTELPVFHNGFSFVFLRTGLIGFVLYGVLLVTMLTLMVRAQFHGATRALSALGVGFWVFAVYATPTLKGLFDAGDTSALMLTIAGAAIAMQLEGVHSTFRRMSQQ